MAWIEFHLKLRDHWKVDRLKDLLGIPYAHALGLLGCLWTWAGEHAPKGDINKFTDHEISKAARWEGVEEGFKNTLKDAEFLDDDGKIHDWNKHGLRLLESNRKSAKKYRKKSYERHMTVMLPSSPTNLTIPNHTLPNLTKQGMVEIPQDLQADKEAIESWLAYKRELGKGYKSRGLAALWARLREIPQENRKKAIDHSMSNGWAGIFEPKGGQSGRVQIAGEAAPREGAYKC